MARLRSRLGALRRDSSGATVVSSTSSHGSRNTLGNGQCSNDLGRCRKYDRLKALSGSVKSEDGHLGGNKLKGVVQSRNNGSTLAVVALCLLYASQGLIKCTSLPLEYLLKDERKATPEFAQTIGAVAQLPLLSKPLLGFLMDAWCVRGSHVNRALITALAAAVTFCSWVAVALEFLPESGLIVALLSASGGAALADVIADGLVCHAGILQPKARCGRKQNASTPSRGFAGRLLDLDIMQLLALSRGCKSTGAMVGEGVGGHLVDFLGPRWTLAGSAVLISGTILAAAILLLFAEDESLSQIPQAGSQEYISGSRDDLIPRKRQTLVQDNLQQLWEGLRHPSFAWCVMLMFLVGAAPTPTVALFYWYTSPASQGGLGLAPSFVGKLRTGMAAARAAGLLLHGSHLATLTPAAQLRWAGAAGTAVGLLQTAVVAWFASTGNGHVPSDVLQQALAIVGIVATSLALAALARVSGITILGAAAEVSSKTGSKSAIFAILMSVWTGSHLLGRLVSSLLMSSCSISRHSFTNLGVMVLICSLGTLAGHIPASQGLARATCRTGQNSQLVGDPSDGNKGNELVSLSAKYLPNPASRQATSKAYTSYQ